MRPLAASKNKPGMRYAFFPGCTASFRAQNYEQSTRGVAAKLGIELVDLEFACCGFPLESIGQEATLLMAARNLAVAGREGLDIMTICNTCAKTLTKYNELLKKNESVSRRVNNSLKKLGYEYKGNITIKHLCRVLYEDLGIREIKENTCHPLTKLRVSTHHGCHYSRPSEIYNNFDEAENPKILDELVEATGSKIVDYENKKMCCGGPLLAIASNTALSLSDEKLDSVKSAGADALVVICPFCGLMYDLCQEEIEERFGGKYRLPVLYLPQLLGLSMGLNPSELGLDLNRVKAEALLGKI